MKTTMSILILALCTTAASAWAIQVTTGGVDDVKVIDVVASRYQFEPATISVTHGERVRLRFRSADAIHSIAIKAFRVNALIPKAGDPVTVEFVADRIGTFPFSCAEYCGTGHGRMKGKLVVLAREK